MIRNLIFDFDGTLVDTAPLIISTMHATIAELHLPPHTDDECRATIGIRLEDMPQVLWPGIGVDPIIFATSYRRIFNELKRPLSVVCFPGVLKTLDAMHTAGYRFAIASSRSRESLEEYVAEFDIAHYFSMLVGGNDVTHGKPAAEPVNKILETCGWKASETMTIGDAPVDILMGRAAGTLTCAVTYGNSTREDLAAVHPTHLIDQFDQLPGIIAK